MRKRWGMELAAVIFCLLIASLAAASSKTGPSKKELENMANQSFSVNGKKQLSQGMESNRAKAKTLNSEASKLRKQRTALFRERRQLHEQMKKNPTSASLRKQMNENSRNAKAIVMSMKGGK